MRIRGQGALVRRRSEAKDAKRGFAGDGKKLVAGGGDPGLPAEALAKAGPGLSAAGYNASAV